MGYRQQYFNQLLHRLFAASPHQAAFHFAWFRAFRFYPASLQQLNLYWAFTTISFLTNNFFKMASSL